MLKLGVSSVDSRRGRDEALSAAQGGWGAAVGGGACGGGADSVALGHPRLPRRQG